MGNSNGVKNIVKLIVSVFYIGFTPRIPGTAASFAALLIFCFGHSNKIFIFSLMIISGILGFAFSGLAEKIFKKKDPKCIVIDEFFAMLLVLVFIKPTLPLLILAFVIFRLMDMLKFWPIKEIEKLSGSAGVMLDDCAAALYTILVVQATMFFISS